MKEREKNMATRILLINAIDSSRGVEVAFPPLNLAYLVSYFRHKSKKSDVIFKIISKDYKKEILSFSPDAVGLTSVTQNYPLAVKIASFCRDKGMPVFIGGIHISTLPSSLNKNFDFGAICEGEETFFEVISLFSKKKKFMKKDLSKIKGLVFFNEKSQLEFTKPREPIKDIDSIPPPDRSIIDIEGDEVFMFSSRGCPYGCYFCSSSSFWGKVRFHSADYVMKEIERIISEYNPKKIVFYDDLFILDRKRLESIVERIEEEGINKSVRFHVSARANLINPEIVSLFKRMNVCSVIIGFESGSAKVLRYLKGDNVSLKDNINAIRLLNDAGIIVFGSFIIGSPIETKETLKETYDFIKKNKVYRFSVHPLTPYPKTKSWDYALEHNIVSDDMDFSRLCIEYPADYAKKIIISEKISEKDLYRYHKKFLRLSLSRQFMLALIVLFIRPQNVFKYLLKRIRSKDFLSFN